MQNKVFQLLVNNNAGVLSRITGLFSRRGYNIDSITAGVTSDPRFTRITIVTSGDEEILDQIEKQVSKLVDVRDKKSCCCDDDFDLASVPDSVCRVFDDSFAVSNDQKRVFVSLGVFSIIKLERHVQLLIPSYDFCIPQKECVGATAPALNRPYRKNSCDTMIHRSFFVMFTGICILR